MCCFIDILLERGELPEQHAKVWKEQTKMYTREIYEKDVLNNLYEKMPPHVFVEVENDDSMFVMNIPTDELVAFEAQFELLKKDGPNRLSVIWQRFKNSIF